MEGDELGLFKQKKPPSKRGLSLEDRLPTFPEQYIHRELIDGLCRVQAGKRYGHTLPRKRRDPALVRDPLRSVLREVCEGRKPFPLYIYGQPGSGKTCAGLCLVDWFGGAFVTAEDFCAELRLARLGELRYWQNGQGGIVSERAFWSTYASAHFLVVDELGEREPSDFRSQAIKKLMDVRELLPTVWIGNLLPAQVRSTYDDRIHSRLMCGTQVAVNGDRRMEGRKC